ncbi:MAG TPA: GNAT family N-acetyltransferase [Candidatus Methylomirabilis sp.]|nr:GNAT family N-acetyltransferase [Candidatus Methylomirabilis sp.]
MRSTGAWRSDRLTLRPVGRADAGFVESLYASPDVTRTLLRIQGPISTEQARDLCGTPVTASGEHRFLAVLRPNRRRVGLGTISRRAARPGVASVGYSVLPEFWGRGIGTALAALLVEFAFGALAAIEVRATTLEDNLASTRVLEKLGFAVSDADAREIDSRGDERRVTRWSLRRGARDP